MQSRNQVLDDLARLITNALGLAQNAGGEIDTVIKSILERYLADRGLVTREEFDMSQAMLEKAINEISDLRKDLNKIKNQQKAKVAPNKKNRATINHK